MSRTPTDRRAFLKSSALIAAPIAALATPGVALAGDDRAARLARIEDERAIEAAHRTFLQTADAKKLRGVKPARKGETVRRIDPDPDAGPPAIDFADDGRSAIARQRCAVQVASEFDGDSTVERMARLQGNAVAVRTKRCVILAHYKKEGGEWTMTSVRTA